MAEYQSTQDTMVSLRSEIDAIDRRLVTVLTERFGLIQRVVAVKTREGLPANIPERVEEVVGAARRLAEAEGLPPDLAETLWRTMVAWTIDYEDAHLHGGRAD